MSNLKEHFQKFETKDVNDAITKKLNESKLDESNTYSENTIKQIIDLSKKIGDKLWKHHKADSLRNPDRIISKLQRILDSLETLDQTI